MKMIKTNTNVKFLLRGQKGAVMDDGANDLAKAADQLKRFVVRLCVESAGIFKGATDHTQHAVDALDPN